MAEEKKKSESEFQFVQEKIKQQPLWKNRIFRKAVLTAGLAVLFGAVSCVTFAVLYPKLQQWLGEDPMQEISIPKDEEPEADGQQDQTNQENQDPIVITETQELELEDYSELFTKMRSVSKEAMKSMVTVTAGSSDMDWFNEQQISEHQVSGLLVGDNGVEKLILTNYSDIKGADQLQVTFVDSAVAEATLKKYDPVTDLAILSVNLGDLESSTREKLRMVVWGNSKIVQAGDPIIAIGSPAGISGSVLFGNLTAVSYDAKAVDGEYQLLLTDLPHADGSGALINFQGQVVGWLQDSYLYSDNEETLTAYGISDLKSIIEHLCNNKDIVYLGIQGVDVPRDLQESEDMPKGIYVTGVEMDSPAMTAGIQSGDIIVSISGQEITSLAKMQELLLNFSEDQVISVKVMRKGKDGLKEIGSSVKLGALK